MLNNVIVCVKHDMPNTIILDVASNPFSVVLMVLDFVFRSNNQKAVDHVKPNFINTGLC